MQSPRGPLHIETTFFDMLRLLPLRSTAFCAVARFNTTKPKPIVRSFTQNAVCLRQLRPALSKTSLAEPLMDLLRNPIKKDFNWLERSKI